jgi:hypothetical protein
MILCAFKYKVFNKKKNVVQKIFSLLNFSKNLSFLPKNIHTKNDCQRLHTRASILV